jgi:hypothetical protein
MDRVVRILGPVLLVMVAACAAAALGSGSVYSDVELVTRGCWHGVLDRGDVDL